MNLGNALYFSHPYVSNSDLCKLLPPKQYTPDLRKAFAEGTLLDCVETSPEYADFLAFRVIGYDYQFTQEQFDTSRRMRDSLRKDAFYQDVKQECVGQQEFYVPEVEFEYDSFKFYLSCRIKYDLWSYNLGWGVDLKTTSATSLNGFLQSIDNYHYDQQRAFYMKVGNARRDILMGVSKVWPYKIFPVLIKSGSHLHNSGCEKMNHLAYQYAKQ